MTATSSAAAPAPSSRLTPTAQPVARQAERPRMLPQQRVAMRDGITLCTDVFLPPDNKATSAVLLRTPYNRAQPFFLRLAMQLNQSGFAAMLQDSRGRYKSEGDLDWRREADDVYDTLEWAGDQEWCDGRVSLIGLSISSLGYFPTLAGELPAGVQVPSVINIMGAVDLHGLFYRQNALVLHWALPWLHIVHGQKDAKAWRNKPWSEIYRTPLEDIADDGTFDADFWRFVLEHPHKDAAWAPYDGMAHLPKIDTPMLHLSGWNDFMLGQVLDAHGGLTGPGDGGPGDRGRGRQKLVVGPWDHVNLLAGRKPGSGNDGGFDIEEMMVGWLERWMRPDSEHSLAARSLAEGPDVLLFVQGERRWVGVDDWQQAQQRELFLDATAGAHSASGDGRLKAEAPASGRDEVLFDPGSPVPTHGGPIWPFPAAGLLSRRENQQEIEARDDVLVYTSMPLVEPWVLAGAVEVELWHGRAGTSGTVDWSARLVHVDGGETPIVIAGGYARILEGSEAGSVRIDLRGVAQLIPAGHRLRLEVAGSNFPQFDLPPGVDAARPQVLLRGGDTASVLRLSVLSEKQMDASRLDPLTDVDRSFFGRTKKRITTKAFEVISAQFGRPRGVLGHVTGWALARLNRVTNQFCLEQLDLQDDDDILEIGFGPGWSIRRAAQAATRGRVHGVDVSSVMLQQARRRNKRAISEGRVELKLGNVNDLPYKEPASFDKVYGVNSIQLWPKPVENLQQVRRLMRPGGIIALALQPQWLRTEAQVRALGGQKLQQLRQAGFVETHLEIKRMMPVPAFCVVATNPETTAD